MADRNAPSADTVIVRGQGHTPGIEVTPNHRFWLRASDRMWSQPERQYRRRWDDPDWAPIGQAIDDEAYWATPAPQTQASPYPDLATLSPPAVFGDNPLAAWWLVGRWLADGSLTFGSGRCDVSICCGFHEENELGDRLDRTGATWKHRAPRTAALFSITSQAARDWLHQQFGHGSAEKHLPGWTLALGRWERQALLDGYVSGDGNTERFTLTREGAEHVITRRVWTDQGHLTFYDEETRDFVTWPGSWVRVDVVGRFPSRLAATQHMIARRGEAAGDAR